MGYKKLGIATCVGLIHETRILTDILTAHGFEVYGAACKVGAIPKAKVGIGEECCDVGVNMCNPVMQAKLLNREKTDMNIVMGHNPVAALYTSGSYYGKMKESQETCE